MQFSLDDDSLAMKASSSKAITRSEPLADIHHTAFPNSIVGYKTVNHFPGPRASNKRFMDGDSNYEFFIWCPDFTSANEFFCQSEQTNKPFGDIVANSSMVVVANYFP